MSATAASPRARSRAVMRTVAFARASATAVSSPMPEFPPVMTTVFPVMSATSIDRSLHLGRAGNVGPHRPA